MPGGCLPLEEARANRDDLGSCAKSLSLFLFLGFLNLLARRLSEQMREGALHADLDTVAGENKERMGRLGDSPCEHGDRRDGVWSFGLVAYGCGVTLHSPSISLPL